MTTAIFWFRRDLRLTDNTALAACAKRFNRVIPVYLLSDWKGSHGWTGPHRQEFLCASLASLSANLEAIGGRLVIRQGQTVKELDRLVRETKASAVYWNRDPDPYGRGVERDVKEWARSHGVETAEFTDVCVFERDEVLNGSGDPFRVFTPYSKAWLKKERPKSMGRLRTLRTPEGVRSLALPTLATWGLRASGSVVEGGEKAARGRLTSFLAGEIAAYGDRRNLPAAEATSRLSQDLRFGLLSIREVVERCEKTAESLPPAGRSSVGKYVSELIWREFYMNILWHFPEVLDQEFNPKYRGMEWPGTRGDFERWCAGQTGFPIVDAAMRELNETGFMHNRTRMIAAMFLTKDLHCDWRWGERYFLQQLTDGEIASNNGGWQWSAGTGADAAPYFRIQNPWTQTARFDPAGEYVHRWVPELCDVSAERFFAAPSGGSLAPKYPMPMVDHARAREVTLELFARQKETGQP